jgi:hypothetical protein
MYIAHLLWFSQYFTVSRHWLKSVMFSSVTRHKFRGVWWTYSPLEYRRKVFDLLKYSIRRLIMTHKLVILWKFQGTPWSPYQDFVMYCWSKSWILNQCLLTVKYWENHRRCAIYIDMVRYILYLLVIFNYIGLGTDENITDFLCAKLTQTWRINLSANWHFPFDMCRW